jgi:tRNA(His) 5'-end guanylyltransferase
MRNDEIEARMRAFEYFHSLRALSGAWIVLRVDGRSFTKLTLKAFEKPFDVRFHGLMVKAAETLLTELAGLYVYTESDEISVLLPQQTQLFDREIEKLVSVSAGIASASFTSGFGAPAHFDSRVWTAPSSGDVIDYFRWRQADAARCALNGWCYYQLLKEGETPAQATKALLGKNVAQKNELLFERGINFNDVPLWQRRGTGIQWTTIQRAGLNPKTNEPTVTTRRVITHDENLPMGDEYDAYLRQIIAASPRAPNRSATDRQRCPACLRDRCEWRRPSW